MSIRLLAAVAIIAAITCEAEAQNFGALAEQANAGGVSYEQARAVLPQLNRVIFEKADANGDGLIGPEELPQLEALYQEAYLSR